MKCGILSQAPEFGHFYGISTLSQNFVRPRGQTWHGISTLSQNFVPTKGTNMAYFCPVQGALQNQLLHVDMMAPSNT